MQLTYPYKGWAIMLVALGGLWLISYIWARLMARGLSLSREMRFGWVHVGDRLEERFTLVNFSPLPALWVEIIDHTTMPDYNSGRVTGVHATGENRWFTQGVCTRRGIFTLGPTTMRTSDPFGLFTITFTQTETATVTVTPPIVPLPTIEVAPGGRVGEGRSRRNPFERTVSSTGVREFLPGDTLNWIHWPTSARQGSLYVRLFDSTPAGDWWIILDLDQAIQLGKGADSTEEHSIILAASLADVGLRAGRSVGLVTYTDTLVWLPPARGDVQRRKILQALAVASPGPRPLAELLARTRPVSSPVASLIVITVGHNPTWVEAMWPLRQNGTIPTVLLLNPASFGGPSGIEGLPAPETYAMLVNLGITCTLINRELLSQAQVQTDAQGQWEWRISSSGRAIPINRPNDMGWKELA